MLKVRWLVIFFGIIASAPAQPLRYIPDINLRTELGRQKLLTNDSLDLRKALSKGQLYIIGKEVENLDGLQYFKNVSELFLSKNKIKLLNHLPPRLSFLDCSENELSKIDTLPAHLGYLNCSSNKISRMENLPGSLTWINFGNNLMVRLPIFSKGLLYINYSQNPIPTDSLPLAFKSIKCDDPSQNCIPYEMLHWRILNSVIKDTTHEITGMKVIISSGYSWGAGSQDERIEFKVKDRKLVSEQSQIIYKRDRNNSSSPKDTSYIQKISYSVDISELKKFIKDTYSNNLIIEIQDENGATILNLKDKKNGDKLCDVQCSDCTFYGIQYKIFSQSDTIKLEYGFNDALESGVLICRGSRSEDIKSILDWIYIYKLSNMTLSKNHWIIKDFFNRRNLAGIAKWLNN